MVVLVTLPMPHLLGEPRGCVAQMVRHLVRSTRFHIGHGSFVGYINRVALGGNGQEHHSLCQRQFAFRGAQALISLGSLQRQRQSPRVCVAYFLAGHAHQATREVGHVHPAVHHAAVPVERGIRVATAHRFMERGDLVVKGVPALVEAPHAVRGGFGSNLAGNFRAVVDKTGGHFEQVQRTPSVAVSGDCQSFERFRRRPQMARTEATLFVSQCRRQQWDEVCRFQWPQRIYLRPRQQCRVHFERGVFGGGAHEHQRAVFHIRQESILLRFVEAMHLVEEQQRSLAGGTTTHLCRLHHFAHIFNARLHRRQLSKFGIGGLGYQARECGLARTRRAPEQGAVQSRAFGQAPQGLAGAQQVGLANHFREHARPHAVRQRTKTIGLSVHRPTHGAPTLQSLQPSGRSLAEPASWRLARQRHSPWRHRGPRRGRASGCPAISP